MASGGGAVQEEGLEVWRRRQSLQASGGVAPNQEASRESTTETTGTDRETGGTQHSVFVYLWEKSFTHFVVLHSSNMLLF